MEAINPEEMLKMQIQQLQNAAKEWLLTFDQDSHPLDTMTRVRNDAYYAKCLLSEMASHSRLIITLAGLANPTDQEGGSDKPR